MKKVILCLFAAAMSLSVLISSVACGGDAGESASEQSRASLSASEYSYNAGSSSGISVIVYG